MRQTAQDMIDVARDGIGWIALWKDGKGWMAMDYYPDINRDNSLIFEDYDIDSLQNILKIDPRAILVNGWYHNLGDTTCMTRDSLAEALRWQYDIQHYPVADVLSYGAHV
jgi:hypothetical protein